MEKVYKPIRTSHLLGKRNFLLRICGACATRETTAEEDLMMETSAFPGWIIHSLMLINDFLFLLYCFTQNLNLFLLDM